MPRNNAIVQGPDYKTMYENLLRKHRAMIAEMSDVPFATAVGGPQEQLQAVPVPASAAPPARVQRLAIAVPVRRHQSVPATAVGGPTEHLQVVPVPASAAPTAQVQRPAIAVPVPRHQCAPALARDAAVASVRMNRTPIVVPAHRQQQSPPLSWSQPPNHALWQLIWCALCNNDPVMRAIDPSDTPPPGRDAIVS